MQHPQKTPDSLLRSVATITELRDRDILERTLAITLAEMMPVTRITMYRILHGSEGDAAMVVAEVDGAAAIVLSRVGMIFPLAQRAEFLAVLESATELVQPLPEKNTFQALYPVSSQHGVIGFMEMISGRSADEDKRIVLAFLRIYRNYLSLLLESETDTLTGLLNRRTFDNNIEKIVAERTVSDSEVAGTGAQSPARRKIASDACHWMAIMDIDHFKKVNDEFGHLYGDEVLLLVAQSMRLVFRQQDKLFRFGGEEFVVVLDRTSRENAREALERFRKTIEGRDFPQVGRVTISIGFVSLAKTDVPSVMVGHADHALYYAKHNGRNQVCQYEELVATGKLAKLHYSEDMQLF